MMLKVNRTKDMVFKLILNLLLEKTNIKVELRKMHFKYCLYFYVLIHTVKKRLIYPMTNNIFKLKMT